MKPRMSLAALMLAVSAIGLSLAGLMELRRWGPERRARELYIRAHQIRADNYDRELATPYHQNPLDDKLRRSSLGSPPSTCELPHIFPMDDNLRQALRLLSDWHSRRAAELRKAGRFDPASEKLRDFESRPDPDDQQVGDWLSDYHSPRMM